MARRVARAACWFAGLFGLLVVLRTAAAGDLSSPPITSLDHLGAWADDRGATAAALALVRLGAEGAVWYLLGLSALHAIAAARRADPGTGIVDLLAPAATARLVRAGLGLGLVASATVQSGSAVVASVPPGTAVMRPVPDDRPSGTARMVPRAAPAPPPAARPPAPSPVPVQHRVEQGDSFWTIATDVLAQRWGRPPSDAEIDPFWRSLVDANRHRLVADDPDLILPGQVLEVPPPPPPP